MRRRWEKTGSQLLLVQTHQALKSMERKIHIYQSSILNFRYGKCCQFFIFYLIQQHSNFHLEQHYRHFKPKLVGVDGDELKDKITNTNSHNACTQTQSSYATCQ